MLRLGGWILPDTFGSAAAVAEGPLANVSFPALTPKETQARHAGELTQQWLRETHSALQSRVNKRDVTQIIGTATSASRLTAIMLAS